MLYGILIFRCSSRLETRAKMEEIADTEWDVHCVETGFEVGWGASRLKWMCEHVVHFGMRWNVLRRAKRTNKSSFLYVCACVVLQATTMMTRAAIALMAWWNIIYDYYQMLLFFWHSHSVNEPRIITQQQKLLEFMMPGAKYFLEYLRVYLVDTCGCALYYFPRNTQNTSISSAFMLWAIILATISYVWGMEMLEIS